MGLLQCLGWDPCGEGGQRGLQCWGERSVHLQDPERPPGSGHKGGRSLSFPRVSLRRDYQTYMDWEKGEGEPYPYFVYGAVCSEVEVDCLTGAHKVKRGWVFSTVTE